MNLEQELACQVSQLRIEKHYKGYYMRLGIVKYLSATIKAQKEVSVPLYKLYQT